MVFNDQSHYNGAGKDVSELATLCQFHSLTHQFCELHALELSLIFVFLYLQFLMMVIAGACWM